MVGARPSRAPGIQWVDRGQTRIQQLCQALNRAGFYVGKWNLHVISQIDQQLPFSTRIMNGNKAARRCCMALRKQDQAGGEFVHVFDPLHTVTLKQGLVGIIASGNGA